MIHDSLAPLLLLVVALAAGCTQSQPPPECVMLHGYAIQHATPHIDEGSSTPFRSVYDGMHVQTPAWVTAPRYDSRQVRLGRRTWWLADVPHTTGDDDATWEVAR